MKVENVKNLPTKIKNVFTLSLITLIVASCGNDRGGVVIDSTGDQGGGTQPGGGGFAFVMLFVMVAICVTAMFTMDRIKKSKERQNSDDK